MNLVVGKLSEEGFLTSSVIRQKGESQNGYFKKTKVPQIFRKTNILFFISSGKKCLFFRKFGVPCFLETPVLRFALLPHYRRLVVKIWNGYCVKSVRIRSFSDPYLVQMRTRKIRTRKTLNTDFFHAVWLGQLFKKKKEYFEYFYWYHQKFWLL